MNETTTDISIKLEPMDIQSPEIKEEKELLIESESQWLPLKFEENEYYQEFLEESSPNVFHQTVIKSENGYEQFTIEYQDENDDYCESDDYAEKEEDGTNKTNNSYTGDNTFEEFNSYLEHYTKDHIEDVEKQEDKVKDGSVNSKILCKSELNNWITNHYIKHECIECNELFTYYELRRHVESNHKEVMEEYESNYEFNNDNGICKKCGQEFLTQFSRYLHSIQHTENAAKLEKHLCKICGLNSTKTLSIHKHIVLKHPEVVKEFTLSGSVTNLQCPLCSKTCGRYSLLFHHFMDKHPEEYKANSCYSCHLCKNKQFSGEELLLQHLIENHELNSWNKLGYRKPFDDKEYFSCEKCSALFLKNNIKKLLKHFLNHEDGYCWTCRFCSKNIDFKQSPISHMCIEMVSYYENHYNMIKDDDTEHKKTIKRVWKIKNLQEFEEYMAHVCPFCNKEFDKLLKWQQHLRKFHQIDTLKGLEMKVIGNDNDKLRCVICHTVVANYPEQLHAHRFQHLPYKPYKCLHCSVTLNTFKMAINHVLKRCNDEVDRDYVKSVLVRAYDVRNLDIRSMVKIQCSFCNYKKFSDVKTVLKHMKDEHNNFEEFSLKNLDNSMTCKICYKQNVQPDKSFFKHLHNHFDEKIFICVLCLRSFHTFKSCYSHLLNAHYVSNFNQQPTDINNQKTSNFPNKEDKVVHVTKVPQLAKPTIRTHVLNQFAEFITYACPECNEDMTTQENWYSHIMTQHNFFEKSNLYIKDVDGSLKCPTCKLAMATGTTQQQKHKLTHMPYKSFICKLCYIRCNSLGILYGHFRRVHFAPGAFECPLCPEILQTSHQRTEHLKETHPRSKWPDSMCLICYKILASKHILNNHMVTHNADRLKYTCDVCGSKIVELRDFNIHMARHHKRVDIELEQNLSDDFSSKSGFKNSQSSHTDIVAQTACIKKDDICVSEAKNFNKRKSLTDSLTTKNKKGHTE